jgi:hypothetical protein
VPVAKEDFKTEAERAAWQRGYDIALPYQGEIDLSFLEAADGAGKRVAAMHPLNNEILDDVDRDGSLSDSEKRAFSAGLIAGVFDKNGARRG